MKFLLVEDDVALAGAIQRLLAEHHYVMDLATDGVMGRDMADLFPYDLILLDWTLPKLEGVELCKYLGDEGNCTPIILLTARNESTDKVAGLDAGADDYLTKPFELEEMLARVRALLRRTDRIPQAAKHSEILSYGPLTLVPERFEAIWFERTVKLTHLEFELLHCLLQRHGQTVAPSEILKEVWGYDPNDDIETIRVHIRHLRTKLEPDPRHPKFIKTVYGAGYCLELPQDDQVFANRAAS